MISFRTLGSATLVTLACVVQQSAAFAPNLATTRTASSATSTSIAASTIARPSTEKFVDKISKENPLRVVIAGAGVGGLALANVLQKNDNFHVRVVERTDEFKRFGGPIQLASNALTVLEQMDQTSYQQIMDKFTFTGDKENGIKDGIRDEWYAKFDLGSPAIARGMPYTGVIERPDLQNIFLDLLKEGIVSNGDGVASYKDVHDGKGVSVVLDSGEVIDGDVLIGADGIWSAVRATLRGEPIRGDGSGVSYSGYTVFAGELDYDSFDVGKVGYKVYIGPGQYFVITDIGNGRYQWYAFLARAPGSSDEEEKPDGASPFLQNIFQGWSKDVHHILKATQEDEIQQRDLYDRPPSVLKPWHKNSVALLGDSVHAMMPNLGQGGCQAIEDAFVLAQELQSAETRSEISNKLSSYQSRRLIRSAAVQGLSRFASDIIIRGFDTPAKFVNDDNGMRVENFNYAGVVTKMLQPILPIFFSIQFNFLYEGWRNEIAIDAKAAFGLFFVGGFILLLGAGTLGEAGLGLGVGLDAIFGGEGIEAIFAGLKDFL